MAGYFFTGEQDLTPEGLDRKRLLLNALRKENLSAAPVGHWTQALARVVGSAADTMEEAQLNRTEKKGTDENKRALMAAFGIGGAVSPGAPTAAAGDPASAPAAAPQGKLPVFAQLNGVNPSLIQSESGGNWQAQNNAMGAGGKAGHFGRLQFGQARLQEAANAGAIPQGTTPQQFMADPNLQMAAERWHFGDIDKAIANGPAAAMIGKTINGVPVTQEGLRAVAHLGGVGGMNKFVQSGGAYNPADANGTTLMAYLQRHAGQGIAQPTSAGPSMQPPASAALVAALGSGQPVNVPPGAPAGTPKIVANNAAPVQPDASAPAPGATPVQQAQFNVPGVGLVPAQGVGQAPAASPGAGMTPQAAALIQALSSPWAARNPMLAQVGQTMLSQQLAGNKFQYQTLPDGTILALDPTGRRAPVPVYQAPPKPISVKEGERLMMPDPSDPRKMVEIGTGGDKKTTDQQNYEAVVKQFQSQGKTPPDFNTWLETMKKAGGTNVQLSTEKRGQELFAARGIEGMDKAMVAATDAQKRIASYGQLASAMQGFTPGATAEARLQAKAILKDLGIIRGTDVADGEAMKAAQRRLELAATPRGQGQITENERTLIREQIPTIATSPEGVAKIIANLQRLDQYDIAVHQIYLESAKANGGIPNYLDVQQKVMALGPPLSPEDLDALKTMTKSGGGTSPQAASAPSPQNQATPKIRQYNPISGRLE